MLANLVAQQDGKFLKAYWQKTKNDEETGSVVADGLQVFIRCNYNPDITTQYIQNFGLTIDGMVLDIVSPYNFKIGDWIYISGKKYTIDDIPSKFPFQEANMYMKSTLLYNTRLVIK